MWDQIQANRRKSTVVVTLMGVLLVGAGAAVGMYFTGNRDGAITGGIVALGIWFLQWVLMRSRGDDVLLAMARARPIEKKDHPQLYNVVEEMRIAAELPAMPRVFIVDDPSPNAFAVGRDPKKAAVAVTIGLLERLNRDELQGVIAHELGHIKNRDVALMTTAGIMVGTIVLLVELGLRALWIGGGRRPRDSGGGGGGAQAILFLVALIFLILAPILAQLVYFALSRRREYLADASGAMFTRWPEGLASALEKIGGVQIPQADQSRVTAPMYIVRPLKPGHRRSLKEAFSTHPPLEKRVRILRAMGRGADYRSYDAAYRDVTGGGGVIGGRALAAAPEQAAAAPPPASDAPPVRRLREASNAYLAGAGYDFTPCPGCGATLKIPPRLKGRLAACPRCGTHLSGR